MRHLTVSAVIAFTWLSVATCQLSCKSQLRLIPSFAHLFTHCECVYSEWTEWIPINSTEVPLSQCDSGRVLIEEKWQRVLSGDCDNRREERNVCEPDLIDQMILSLGLGSTGQHITPGGASPNIYVYLPATPQSNQEKSVAAMYTDLYLLSFPVYKPDCSTTRQVCHNFTTQHDRRSVREEMKRPHINKRRSLSEPEPLPVDPTPFNVLEHGARYRRQQENECLPNGMRHILFILDTSGSIRETNFNRITAALSTLVLLFCRPIKIAVMTFDHEYFVEFCFNCFENTCTGRYDAGVAIRSINYTRYDGTGTRWTHTAGAAQCVCNFMLSETCGLSLTANCIDVVFITDGRSNDPNHDVCSEIRCLHNRFGVNTFAIGIGYVNITELECIVNHDIGPGQFHLFNFLSFNEFHNKMQEMIHRLMIPASSDSDPYTCIDPEVSGGGTDEVPCTTPVYNHL